MPVSPQKANKPIRLRLQQCATATAGRAGGRKNSPAKRPAVPQSATANTSGNKESTQLQHTTITQAAVYQAPPSTTGQLLRCVRSPCGAPGASTCIFVPGSCASLGGPPTGHCQNRRAGLLPPKPRALSRLRLVAGCSSKGPICRLDKRGFQAHLTVGLSNHCAMVAIICICGLGLALAQVPALTGEYKCGCKSEVPQQICQSQHHPLRSDTSAVQGSSSSWSGLLKFRLQDTGMFDVTPGISTGRSPILRFHLHFSGTSVGWARIRLPAWRRWAWLYGYRRDPLTVAPSFCNGACLTHQLSGYCR